MIKMCLKYQVKWELLEKYCVLTLYNLMESKD